MKEGVDIGSEIVFATPFHRWPNGTVLAKALDNRISCVVLIKTLEALHGRLNKVGVYGMFTVQEEIGAREPGVVAFDIRPNLTITLDNVPTKNPDQVSSGDVDFGRGPVVRIFDWHPATSWGCSPTRRSNTAFWKLPRGRRNPAPERRRGEHLPGFLHGPPHRRGGLREGPSASPPLFPQPGGDEPFERHGEWSETAGFFREEP